MTYTKMAAERKESGRIREAEKKRVLDEASRKRRARKALEALEYDNFQADPHADLKMSKKAPKFEESMEHCSARKKKKNKVDQLKRSRKTFNALLEEEQMLVKEPPNYFSAAVPPSKFPEKRFCAICGFPSWYTCVSCGARYCCSKCLSTHRDTRCLKYTA